MWGYSTDPHPLTVIIVPAWPSFSVLTLKASRVGPSLLVVGASTYNLPAFPSTARRVRLHLAASAYNLSAFSSTARRVCLHIGASASDSYAFSFTARRFHLQLGASASDSSASLSTA